MVGRNRYVSGRFCCCRDREGAGWSGDDRLKACRITGLYDNAASSCSDAIANPTISKRDKTKMDLNNAHNVWRRIFFDWPVWIRVTGVIAVLCLVSFLIIEQGEDISISITGFTATRPETPLEKNCRLATQQTSALDQEISNEIIALEFQVAAKDRELSDTRSKCLAAQAKKTPAPDIDGIPSHHFQTPQSACRTEISTSNEFGSSFAHPIGDYETALTDAAQDRYELKSKISEKEKFRTQQQQRLDQLCFGIVTQRSISNSAQRP